VCSFWRKIFESPHPLAAMGYPPLTSQVGLETSYSTTSQKSDITIGLKHSRHTYNYQVALTSAVPAVQMSFDSALSPEMPNLRWGLTGQVNYDGSGESVIGMSLVFNL
jgi:hypothetical protein